MAGCAHCAGCCAHCGSVCGGFHGVPSAHVGTAFHMGGGGGYVPYYGGIGFMPWMGGGFFWHRHHDDDDANGADSTTTGDGNADDDKFHAAVGEATTATKVNCDALVDPDHPEHRDAVQAIAHTDEAVHQSLMERVKTELAKL